MANSAELLTPTDLHTTEQALERWLDDAADKNWFGKRQHGRYPYFRPVNVTLGIPRETEVSAFSTDISQTGIGLLHHSNLPLQEVTLAIETNVGLFVRCRAKVAWTRPCGNRWYRSGMRTTGILNPAI